MKHGLGYYLCFCLLLLVVPSTTQAAGYTFSSWLNLTSPKFFKQFTVDKTVTSNHTPLPTINPSPTSDQIAAIHLPTVISETISSSEPSPTPNTYTTSPTFTPSPQPTTTPTATPHPTTVPTSQPTATPNPPVAPTPSPTSATITTSSTSQSLLNQVNDYRHSQGLDSVSNDSYTCDFAKIRAEEISHSFDHNGFQDRMNKHTLPYPSYSYVTENIAENSDVNQVVPNWINSAPHAENMRADTPYVCIGISGNYYTLEGYKP